MRCAVWIRASLCVAVAATLALPGGFVRTEAQSVPEYVPQFSDALVFQGTATVTSGDCGAAICWVGGSAAFTFTSSLCEYVSDAMDSPPDVGPGACSFTGGGNVDAFDCGNGVAYGSAAATGLTGPDAGEGTTTISFFIVFVGGVGVIVSGGTEPDSGNIIDVGVVSPAALPAVPNPLAPNLGPCASSFTATAVDVIFDA